MHMYICMYMYACICISIFTSLWKFQDYREDIKDLVTDSITYMHKALQDRKSILVEGANATMLDIDFGGCTSQECSLTEFSPSTDQGTETHYAGLGCACFEKQHMPVGKSRHQQSVLRLCATPGIVHPHKAGSQHTVSETVVIQPELNTF